MAITWEVIAAFITAMTAIAGVWWRVEAMIRKNTDDLAAHRLHVAETYVNKNSMREVVAPIMEVVRDIKSSITYLTERVDSIAHGQPPRR